MSAIYPSARTLGCTTGLGLLTNDIRIVLVDVGYVYSAAHDFLNDVGAGTRVATSAALTTKTVTDGVFDADNVLFTALTGDTITGIILYNHTGVEGTSNLLVYYDALATGSLISFTPGGTNVTVTWSNGATKIFKL